MGDILVRYRWGGLTESRCPESRDWLLFKKAPGVAVKDGGGRKVRRLRSREKREKRWMRQQNRINLDAGRTVQLQLRRT
jgi:hypothetical protein